MLRSASKAHRLVLFLIVLLAGGAAFAEDADHPDLLRFAADYERLVSAPGISRSPAAGLVNPAAWSVNAREGLYLAWEETSAMGGASDLRAALSLGSLGYGFRRTALGYDDGSADTHYDHTLGLSFGDRAGGFGLSYSWTTGAEGTFGESSRIAMGHLSRWRQASLGLTATYDLESEDAFYQADLGFRPLGPRWTFFTDAVLRSGDDLPDPGNPGENFDDLVLAVGAEARILPGLSLAARYRDTGEISVGVQVGFDGMRPAVRHHMDEDGNSVSTTYAVDFTRGDHLGQALPGGGKYPELHLRGNMTYRNYRYFDERRNFLATQKYIADLALDPAVDGIVLNLSGMALNPAKLWELRSQLAGFRAAGKKVVVYFDRLNIFGYELATVADEIWMDPVGDLDVKGFAFGRSYYKRMLDKLGIGIDEWRYFRYKSAVESFARTDRSDGDREQMERLVESWYEDLVASVIATRGISRAEWDAIVSDLAELTAPEALEAGLVDKLGDFHEARDKAREAGRRSTRDPAAGKLTGLFGDPVWAAEEWGAPPRIAVLYAIGGCSMDSGIEGRRLSKVIRKLREDNSVKAVILRADSPGGDPLPSDLVSRELKETAKVKPVIVSQGMVAASGGYWISMHSDAILASPYTITGSIGVISAHIWDDGGADKLGIDYDVIQRGEHSDVNSGPSLPFVGVSLPHRPVTEHERERGMKWMLDLYEDFTAQVAEGRGMSQEEIKEIGQGRVWTGSDGLDNGLIDEIGGLWECLHLAKSRAGIPEERAVQIVSGPDLGLFNPGMFQPSFLGIKLPGVREALGLEAGPLAGEPWSRLSAGERVYLDQLFAAEGKPLLMLEPLAVDGVTLEP